MASLSGPTGVFDVSLESVSFRPPEKAVQCVISMRCQYTERKRRASYPKNGAITSLLVELASRSTLVRIILPRPDADVFRDIVESVWV